MARGVLLLLAIVALLQTGFVNADLYSHKYLDREEVIVWANKVGPFQNPQEAYSFFDLPFCKPSVEAEASEGLGEALQGYELVRSAVSLPFGANLVSTHVCEVQLTASQTRAFRHAVINNYWYQLFVDDLPLWGRVGEVVQQRDGQDQIYVYTHQKFAVGRNGNRIIEVNMTTENPVLLKEGTVLPFTFSARWWTTDVDFDQRFDKYLDETFFEHQIHWFSIFNSFMMVIFLTGLVAIILMRTLKKDFAGSARMEEEAGELGDLVDDSGWKRVRGDVFRAPPYLELFAALLGTGYQLIFLVFSIIVLAIYADFYEDRGSVMTALVVCYTLTSGIGGYGGGSFYARYGGKHWIRTFTLTTLLLPGIYFGVLVALNIIATSYNSLAQVEISTMSLLVAIWLFVAVPLTLLGTVLGRNWSGKPDFPCRVGHPPTPIPEKSWYQSPWFHIAVGGLLPFGSIFIEMYFVFTSFWHYKYYYVYGFMLLVYCILIIVSICVTIVSTYFLLNSEDHRWHWSAFLSSASTAFYVFLYSIYYFYARTRMTGFFQTTYYYAYMAMFCMSLGILCGSIGYIGTSFFVRRIYQMKID